MPLTPDRFPGEREEDEGILLDPQAVPPTQDGEIKYVSGEGFRFFEEGVERGLGITPTQHEVLPQLIHLADGVGGPMEGFSSGSYRETLPSGTPFPTSVIWWTDSTKTKKIVQKMITFNSTYMPTQVSWSAFDATGTTVVATVTDTITYTMNVFEQSRTRTVT